MLLLILLLILIFAAVPAWPYSRGLGLLSQRRSGYDPLDIGHSNAAGLHPHIAALRTDCLPRLRGVYFFFGPKGVPACTSSGSSTGGR